MPLKPSASTSGVLGMKVIKPPDGMFSEIYQTHLGKAVDRVMTEEMGIVERAFKRTCSTWVNQPVFQTKKELMRFRGKGGAGRSRIWIWTDDEVYNYINHGTEIRWAVMSGDFKSKSNPRIIGARRGQGGPVIVGRRAMQARGIRPRPGIEARKFDDEIAKRRQPWYLKKMNNEIALAMKRANREIERQTKVEEAK